MVFRIAARVVRFGMACYQRVYVRVAAFDERARHVQVLRLFWWPVVVVWWGVTWVIRQIFQFVGAVPYRFLARVAGVVTVFALGLVVFHNWRAEQRWTNFRKRASADGIALRLPGLPPPAIPNAENLAAGFPFASITETTTSYFLLRNSDWRPANLIPSSFGSRPDFTVRFKNRRTRRLWAQRLRGGKHLKESRLRESSPVGPTPRGFLALFEGPAAPVWDAVLRAEAKPKTQIESGVVRTSERVWPSVAFGTFSNVAELHVCRAVALIDLGRSQDAVGEVRGIWRLYDAAQCESGITHQSRLLHLLRSGVNTIWAGLDKHAWSESHLAEFDRLLENTDVVANYARMADEYRCAINEDLESVLGQAWSDRLKALDRIDLNDAVEFGFELRGNLKAVSTLGWRGILSDWVKAANLDQLGPLSDGWIRDQQLEINEQLELVRRHLDEMKGQGEEKQVGRSLLSIPRCRLGLETEAYAIAEYYRRMNILVIGGLAQLRQAKIAIAIERFQRRHNQLPDSVEKLIPEYLPAVPIDPFDGKVMRYKVEGPDSYRLWAVGADFTDEMGVFIAGAKAGKDTDVVWRRLPPQ